MIGLDTNLLVRLLVQDDRRQAERVGDLLARCDENGTRCLVTTIALCELEWVLSSAYGVPRTEIADSVEALLADDLIEVERAEQVRRAVRQFRNGKGDLSDHLLGATSQALGAGTVYTLDRELRDSEAFTLL